MEYRNEIKFTISDFLSTKLENRLELIMKKDVHSNGSYRIRSLYFDDFLNSCLDDNLSGVKYRKKYRIRVYNSNFDNIYLEKKEKYNQYTIKNRIDVSYNELINIMSETYDLIDFRRDKLLEELYYEYTLNGIKPKAIVEYDRKSYVESNGNVRITIDSGLRGSKIVEHFINGDINSVAISNVKILEIKYDNYLPNYIKSLLMELGILRSSYSKYANVYLKV